MFLIGCFLYYKDRGKYLFHFLFFWIAFCPSIYAFVVPMTDEAYWQILSWATKLAYLAMLDTLVINRSKYIIHQRKIAMLFCVALVYVLFLIAIENPSSVRPFSREKSRDSDDGIPNGIRRRTDKGYATCYGSGQEKYGNSALTRKNSCAG